MKHIMIAALTAASVLLMGCSAAQPQRIEYIGADSAKSAALEAAGLSDASFSGVDMTTRDGVDYYEVEFSANGQTYRYDVDALTGIVIEQSAPAAAPAAATAAPSAPAVAEPALPSPCVNEGAPAASPAPAAAGGSITEADAKAIALAHAGLSEAEVQFVSCKQDYDDGRLEYEVEFYFTDGDVIREYDYSIDAGSGAITDYDHDAEHYTKPGSGAAQSGSSAGNGAAITADEAKAKALSQVPGAAPSDIREFKTDHDDGRLEYEGTIIYNGMEYEFEIDGYSGAIRSWEVESIYD